MAEENQKQKLGEGLTIELISIDEIKVYENNTRTHSREQIEQLKSSIKEFGFTNPILIDEDNVLIAGHGRTEAGKQLGLSNVPAIRLSNLTYEQKIALRIADNKLALNAGWNDELLRIELTELKNGDYDLGVLGFSTQELDGIFGEELDADETYTAKVETPIYEPKMDAPPEVDALCDVEKYKALIAEIDSSNINEDIKEFLRMSATRHLSFDYKMIAEFYAHQPKEVQELFENSALVIIDFNKAIENGFVKMSQKLSDLMEGEGDEE